MLSGGSAACCPPRVPLPHSREHSAIRVPGHFNGFLAAPARRAAVHASPRGHPRAFISVRLGVNSCTPGDGRHPLFTRECHACAPTAPSAIATHEHKIVRSNARKGLFAAPGAPRWVYRAAGSRSHESEGGRGAPPNTGGRTREWADRCHSTKASPSTHGHHRPLASTTVHYWPLVVPREGLVTYSAISDTTEPVLEA